MEMLVNLSDNLVAFWISTNLYRFNVILLLIDAHNSKLKAFYVAIALILFSIFSSHWQSHLNPSVRPRL